jgi:nicotinamidase-related amidase
MTEMARSATLLMDLQVDFLDSKGRMPVGEDNAQRVIAAANAVLCGQAMPGSLAVVVVNAFPQSQRMQNLFRRNAAIAGSPGAAIDPRVQLTSDIPVFSKQKGNAFSNPMLHSFLQSKKVNRICIVGVFAEGCVRATAMGAKALGYAVSAPLEAIATNANWKLWFAARSMRAHGVDVQNCLSEVGLAI